MLSGILQTLISEENFVAISEAAAYKGPDSLRHGPGSLQVLLLVTTILLVPTR